MPYSRKIRISLWILSPMLIVTALTPPAFAIDQSQIATSLKLPASFTLSYQVTRTDLRSDEMKKSLVDYEKQSSKFLVDSGQMPQSSADRKVQSAEAAAQQSAPFNYSAVLSYSDGKILLHEKAGNQNIVYLYDGQNSYEIHFGEVLLSGTIKHKYRSVAVMRGYQTLIQDTILPIPGVGVDGIPIVKDAVIKSQTPTKISLIGQSPVISRGGDGSVAYQPSYVDLQPDGANGFKMTRCLVDSQYGTEQTWDYRSHVKLGGVWAASDMTFTDFQGYKESSGQVVRGPKTAYAFKLTNATPDSAAKELFDITGWLKDDDTINDFRNPPRTVGYSYRQQGGSLDEQFMRAKLEQSQRKPAPSFGNGSSAAGGILILVALVCVGAGWFIARRKARA